MHYTLTAVLLASVILGDLFCWQGTLRAVLHGPFKQKPCIHNSEMFVRAYIWCPGKMSTHIQLMK